jgi:hypothetical protein
MGVDGLLGDAGQRGDVVDARAQIAVSQEERTGGVEYGRSAGEARGAAFRLGEVTAGSSR